jgi:uncharacterized Zn finger protein (UPF0148 family)
MTCSKCGGPLGRQSGFRRCKKCGHVAGTQDVQKPHTQYNETSFASVPADEWEDETLMRDKPGKQGTPLNFDQS